MSVHLILTGDTKGVFSGDSVLATSVSADTTVRSHFLKDKLRDSR